MFERYTVEIEGWVLETFYPVDESAHAGLSDYVRRMEGGALRNWVLSHPTGGVMMAFPAEWGELAVLQYAQVQFGDRGTVRVELKDQRPGQRDSLGRGWFRHPDFPGCISILDRPARQADLFG